MILSRSEIETIAIGVVRDFKQCFWDPSTIRDNTPRAIPIDQFAQEYLGLDVNYYPLSKDGHLCGLTAYADTEILLEINGQIQKIPLKQNQVILDSNFLKDGHIKESCGKRRFTLAHECAHQILYQLGHDSVKKDSAHLYSCRTVCAPRELKTREDWNEWQANALGSAILMPCEDLETALEKYRIRYPLKAYAGHFPYLDRMALDTLCRIFGTSRTAMAIRLEHLGLLKQLPRFEFHDPVEVII